MKSHYKIVVTYTKGKQVLTASNFGTPTETCHQAKSLAGSMFHSPCVTRVKVKDSFGTTYLVLDKDKPDANFSLSSDLARIV